MAHNLATGTNGIMMAYQGETPWHKLGQRMNSSADVNAALDAAHLNWKVSLEPLQLADGRIVTSRKAVIREEGKRDILGTVGSSYHPIQNTQAFEVLSDACKDFGVTIESAGAIANGAKTWMLAKMPLSVTPTPGDEVKGHFLVVNAHDGSAAYGARPTPIRVVCQNTLSAALSSGRDMISIRHTENAAARLDESKRLIDRMFAAMKESGDTFSKLAEKRMSPKDLANYIKTMFPDPASGEKPSDLLMARRETIAHLVWTGKGHELAGTDKDGTTAWGAYNAVVEYFDHVRPGEANSASGRLNANISATFGKNFAVKVAALKAARQFAFA